MRSLVGRLAAACALASATFAPVAHAQVASGHSGSPGPRAGVPEEFWWALRQMGECFAKTKAEHAKELLATEPRSQAEANAASSLLGRYTVCLRHGNRIRLTTDVLRGAVAEALYKKEFSAAPPPVLGSAVSGMSEVASAGGHRLLTSFARCYASIQPESVHRLLTTTKLGGKQERAELSTMKPDFARCLPPNSAFNFHPSDVRLAMAEALYRRSSALRAGQIDA